MATISEAELKDAVEDVFLADIQGLPLFRLTELQE